MEEDQSNSYINNIVDLVSLSLLNDEEDAKLLEKIMSKSKKIFKIVYPNKYINIYLHSK